MMIGKTCAFLGLLAASLVAGHAGAAPCHHGVKGTVTDVQGDPSYAELMRDGQMFAVGRNDLLCGGDVLTAGPQTTILYRKDGRPARVSGASTTIPRSEGQAMEALSADSVPSDGSGKDDDPH